MDPTFWVSLFACLGIAVKSYFDYKAQRAQQTKAEIVEAKVDEGNAITREVKHEVNSRTDALLDRVAALEKQIRGTGGEPDPAPPKP